MYVVVKKSIHYYNIRRPDASRWRGLKSKYDGQIVKREKVSALNMIFNDEKHNK